MRPPPICRIDPARATPLAAALLSACAAVTLCGAPDLQPRNGRRELEGVSVPTHQFADAGCTITYDPPSGWRFDSAASDRCTLVSPRRASATIEIRIVAPLRGEISGSRFLQFCQGFLPRNVAVREAAWGKAAFTLCRSPGAEARFEGALGGVQHSFTCSVYAFNDYWLVFLCRAESAEFAQVRAELLQSQCSWAWSDESRLRPAPVSVGPPPPGTPPP